MKRYFLSLLSFLSFVGFGAASADQRYPAHWWEPVNDPNKPSWEILPQEAGPGEVILSKRNELGILSNFAATPFVYRGQTYASVEGFWQMMKFPENSEDARAKFPGLDWKFTRAEVAAMTAFDAKAAGDIGSANMKKMGIDWVSFEGKHFAYRAKQPAEHYRLIFDAMKAKLDQNANVREILLKTGDLILRPDHAQIPSDPPEWRYFEIWMELRSLISPSA